MISKWIAVLFVILYVPLVMFIGVPQLVSAPDTISNVAGVIIFVLSIPTIYVFLKKVFK